MKLVIPVSHVDLAMAERLAKRIVQLGQMEAEHVIVIATRRAAWDVDPILTTLQPGFKTIEKFVLPDECEEGWPESANHLFTEAVAFLYRSQNRDSWFWCESDCMPLRIGWWQEILQDYKIGERPFMGFVHPSRYLNLETKEMFIEGEHMTGCGAYPADILERSPRLGYLARVPFDVWIGPDVVPQCYQTKLISHHWGSGNYRREPDGQIYCDSNDLTKSYNAGIVPAAACLNHGDKSGSLLRLLVLEDALQG